MWKVQTHAVTNRAWLINTGTSNTMLPTRYPPYDYNLVGLHEHEFLPIAQAYLLCDQFNLRDYGEVE